MPSDYETKERTLLDSKVSYFHGTGYEGTSYPMNEIVLESGAIRRWESVTSRRNGWKSQAKHDSDCGGEFTKLDYNSFRVPAKYTADNWIYHYYGDLLSPVTSPTVNSIKTTFAGLTLSKSTLEAVGTSFIAAASPTRPRAGLTTALAELKREGLPRLSSEALSALRHGFPKRALRGSGSDYLNWQFGWLPIISDLKDLAASVIEADELLSQLYRDDGKIVRRRRGDPAGEKVLSETSSETSSYGNPVMVTRMYPQGAGKFFATTKVTRSQWFSGAFMYHLPENVTPLGKLHTLATDARYLYGLALTPVDVWNLVPWSWLVDWFSNVGEVISSFSDQIYNDQVLKYGYVMARTKREYATHLTINVNGRVYTPSTMQVHEVKQRAQATPFGFGLDWQGLSPYQISILAALGLSRTR